MDNPLLSPDPHAWDRLIEGAGPASLLLAIERRLGSGLRSHLAPEDVLQEMLLRAWRARDAIEWQGKRAFRTWLLTLADRCIRDAADHFNAVKRGGRVSTLPFGDLEHSSEPGAPHARDRATFAGPVRTTTPSRVATAREQADAMRCALESLPHELSEPIRLRIIEQMPLAEVAAALGISESATRHRIRRGAHLFERALAITRADRSVPEKYDPRPALPDRTSAPEKSGADPARKGP
ncbi:MAG: RNA polymerase sigma factor [Phycisphaerales bacterium]